MNQTLSGSCGTASRHKTYHCGSLTYTKAGLTALFAWLLWGDFCFTLMETVVPTILPLNLKNSGCSNLMLGLIMTTGPCILSMTVCPYVSFKSDRYRSKWGRRIPFIVWTMPFLCLSLALLGWSGDITAFLQNHITYFRNCIPASITVGLIAVFMIMFTFFNMFVGSVFWYLFNDVVPPQFLGRFVGMFRIVGTAAGAGYNYFIFKYAETNMREILICASVLYLAGFGLMCFFVREGQYPPVEDVNNGPRAKHFEGIKSFFRESFSNKFYLLFFLFGSFSSVAYAITSFNVFFYKNIGLTLDQIGKMNAALAVAAMFAMYLASIFIDRWHPIRVAAYLTVFTVIIVMMNWIWVFIELPAAYFFWLNLGIGLITTFQAAMSAGYVLPLFMRLLPKSRYGQFCSADALMRSLGAICAGVLTGLFMDFTRWCCNGSDFGYRFIFIWSSFFTIICAILILLLYRKWYSLGGDANYHPPASWNQNGIEEIPIVTITGPQTKWLRWALRSFHATMVLSFTGVIVLLLWMRFKAAALAFYWHLNLLLPLAVAAWYMWWMLERGIWRDIARARSSGKLHNGIPHHGVLLIAGIQFFLLTCLWIYQVVISINLKMEMAAVIFTANIILIHFLEIFSVWIMCRVERGYSNIVDENLSISSDDIINHA
jgi:MFS family permease